MAETKKNVVKLKPRTVSVSNRSELSATQPIPFEGGRGFSYVNAEEYIPFLSTDNNYAKLLLESRLLSNTHNACIVTKKDYCAGAGFQFKDNATIPKAVTDWLTSVNVKNQSAVKLNKKLFESHFTFGNTPIELVRFTFRKKKYLYIYVHNFLEWRLCPPDDDDDIVQEAVQSKLFARNDMVLTANDFKKARKLPIYNPRKSDKKNWKVIDGTERTLIWYKNEVAGFDYYGLPSAIAGLIYQNLEYKGARYNLDNFDNNMVVSTILALKGNFSTPEINRIGKNIVATHTGDGKRGRVMVVGSEEGIDGSDVHSLETHKEGSYNEADDRWVQKIILANQWDAVLAGILSNNSIGKGSGFLSKILEVKKNTVIRPAQEDLIDEVWANIFDIANEWLGFNIDWQNIEIKGAVDISALTDVDVTPAVMVDEVREAKGLKKINGKKGSKMLGELGADQKKGVYVKQNSKKPAKSEE